MDNLTAQFIAEAMNGMFKESHFSICTVDSALKLACIPSQDSHAYNMLRIMHCKDWAQMSPEVKNSIPMLIDRVFGEEIPMEDNAAQFEPAPSYEQPRTSRTFEHEQPASTSVTTMKPKASVPKLGFLANLQNR